VGNTTRRASHIKGKRVCSICETDTTRTKRTGQHRDDGTPYEYPYWFRDLKTREWICSYCKYRLEYTPNRSEKTIFFKDRYIRVNRKPRIGICNFCRGVRGQINAQTGVFVKLTAMAHMEYHDDDPLKDAIEACVRCHTLYDRGITS
jgi:hypothetical protein